MTPYILHSTTGTVSQMADAVIPLCINFAMRLLFIAQKRLRSTRYSRDRVETVVIVTNLHIVSGKHTLCTTRKPRKDAARRTDVHYCLVHPSSMMCYVQTYRFISSEMVIVIRTHPRLAITRASVNHVAAVHCARIRDVPRTSLSASLQNVSAKHSQSCSCNELDAFRENCKCIRESNRNSSAPNAIFGN